MKRQDIIFTRKSMFVLLLLTSIMLFTSIAYAQELQSKSGEIESTNHQEGIQANTPVYDAWMLAVQYRFDELPEDAEIVQNPLILEQIAYLRGDELRYFLDSIQAINRVENTLFPPSSPNSQEDTEMTISEQRKLVDIATANVFSQRKEQETKLNEREQVYVTELQAILDAIVKGNGDTFFTANYLEYRAEIISFIEDTGAKLFDPSQEAVDAYLEYFGIDDEQFVDLSLNLALRASCTKTYTIDNWPSKSTTYSGNTGSSWREAKAHDQNDCDIFISYYMGSTPHYGVISANTSSAQCVLDKTSQLRGSWSGNFNNVQYGKNTVTWGWPFGCNTTGNALRGATKWRP